jgi:acetyl-CoA C-acetyltransferase
VSIPPDDRAPVIIGIGETTERPENLAAARDSLHLMADAMRTADADAGSGWLGQIDSLDIVRSVAWGYRDLPGGLCRQLEITPKRVNLGPGGGERPTYDVHMAALAIAEGRSEVAVVCGGESQWTVDRALRNNITLPWPADDRSTNPRRDRQQSLHPIAWKYGLHAPIHVYPLYENATLAAWGQSPTEAHWEAAQLWEGYSAVATSNPHAWMKRSYTAAEIGAISPHNRRVAWPYLKLMVAQASVNFGSALIMTSYSRALSMGIPENRMVFVIDGAAADEPKQYLERDRYDHSTAQNAVLKSLLQRREWTRSQFDFVELYSCFPTVAKMARRTLGMPADPAPTVTGGLTFFGGPLNNYMSHAQIAMVRTLRRTPGASGLLYGQGGYVTNHHALVLASAPSSLSRLGQFDVQSEADRRRGPVPDIVDGFEGRARVESFTVVYDRDGLAEFGVVIARNPLGARLAARVNGEDVQTIALLTDPLHSPVGTYGSCTVNGEGLQIWKP